MKNGYKLFSNGTDAPFVKRDERRGKLFLECYKEEFTLQRGIQNIQIVSKKIFHIVQLQ